MSSNLLPWRLTRGQWAAVAVAAVALVAVAGFVLYESDRERLDDLLESTLTALEEGDLDAAMQGVSPEFRSYGLKREQLAKLLDSAIQRYGEPELSALKKEFRIQPPYASCRFTLLAWGPGAGRRPVRTRWVVSFEKTDERWYIIGLESRSGLGDYLQRAKSLADQLDVDLKPQK